MNTSAKKIYFYLGLDGDNGKSQVRKLLAGLCGDFSTSLDKDLLIGTKGSKGRATTWIEPLVKSRLTMSDELGKSDVISCAKLKEITGETPIAFRSLFTDQKRNFIHSCTVKLNTNCIAKIDSLDAATVNRILIIPCEKQFKDQPDLRRVAIDCMGRSFGKEMKRNPVLAKQLLEQDGIDALFTIL